MGSRFEKLYDNIRLSGEKTDEILRKAKQMKNENERRAWNRKNIYVTLSAVLAVVVLTVFGGNYLLQSGILDRGNAALSDNDDAGVIADLQPDADDISDEAAQDSGTDEQDKFNELSEKLKVLYAELGEAYVKLGEAYDNLDQSYFEDIDRMTKEISELVSSLPIDYHWGDQDWDWDDSWYNNYGDWNAYNNYSTDLNELRAMLYEEAKIYEQSWAEGISSVKIEVICSDIKVTQGGDELFIRYGEWYDNQYKVDIKDGKLTITTDLRLPYYKDEKNNSYTNDWIWKAIKGREVPFEIVIPEGMEIDLDFNVVDGDIDVSGGVYQGKISTNVVSGDTTITNSTINGRITINAVSGKAVITDSTINGKLITNAVSGDIKLFNCTTDKINTSVIDGNVNLDTVKANGEINVSMMDGKTTIKNSEVKGEVSISTFGGKITITDCDIQGKIGISNNYNEKNYEIENTTYEDLYINGKKQ